MKSLRTSSLALVGVLLLAATARGSDTPAREVFDLVLLRKERQELIANNPVRPRTAKRIGEALEFLELDELEPSRRMLEKIPPSQLNPYEEAVLSRLIAYTAFSMEDYDGAIEAFSAAVDTAALPIDEEIRVRFNIAQLHASRGQWRGAVNALNEWFRYVEDPNPLAYFLLAIAYYQLGEMQSAIEPARKAVELSSEPREGWLQLLSALYTQIEDYASATPVLERLVTLFPKKQHWVQLSLIYAARESYQNSLTVQQLAYAQGLLTEDLELRRLARSYLYHELPYEAAKVLSKGLEEGQIPKEVDTLEMLANSWIGAREYGRSLVPLERAAELSEEGKLFVRLGRVYIQREQWSEAARYLERALKKGGLDDPGAAEILIGISLYSEGNPGAAHRWFARARERHKHREEAQTWLDHLERERADAQSSS